MNMNSMHSSAPGPIQYQGGHSGFQGSGPEGHSSSNVSNVGQSGHYPQHQSVHHHTLPAGNGTSEAQRQHRIPSSVRAAASIRDTQHHQGAVRPAPAPAPQYHVGGQSHTPQRSTTLPDPLHFIYAESNRSAPVASTSSHPRLSDNTQGVRRSSNPYPQFPSSADSSGHRRRTSEDRPSSATTPHRPIAPPNSLPVLYPASVHRAPSNHAPPPVREAPAAKSYPPGPPTTAPPNPPKPSKHSDGLPLHPSDPFVAASCEAALNPVRAGIENVWSLMVNNVRDAMHKMNQDFVTLATAERQKNSHLMTCLSQTETKLNAALEEAKTLRQEKHEFVQNLNRAKNIMGGYREELARLRAEKEKVEVEYKVLAGLQKERVMTMTPRGEEPGQVPQVTMNYMNSVVSAVSEQVARQMEEKMTAVLNEVQEQQSLRLQAEQKAAEAFRELEHAKGLPERPPSAASEPLPISRPASIPTPESRRISRMNTPPQEPPRFAFNAVQDQQRYMQTLSSPHILSGAPSLKRLSPSSRSSTATHVDPFLSPTAPKHLAAPDRDTDEIVDLTTPEPVDMDVREDSAAQAHSFVASPTLPPPPPHLGHEQPTPSPLQPARKRTRAEYEADDGSTEYEESMAREAPPAIRIKAESHPHSDLSSSSARLACSSSSVPEQPSSMLRAEAGGVPVKPEPEEEYEEYEEGELIDEHVKVEEEVSVTAKIPVEETFNSRSHHTPRQKPDNVQPPVPRISKLGISHIDLLYRADNTSMTCRMCLTRRQEAATSSPDRRPSPGRMSLTTFPKSASWSELITHCQTEHPKACQDLERLTPGQITEMKQRMRSGQFMRV